MDKVLPSHVPIPAILSSTQSSKSPIARKSHQDGRPRLGRLPSFTPMLRITRSWQNFQVGISISVTGNAPPFVIHVETWKGKNVQSAKNSMVSKTIGTLTTPTIMPQSRRLPFPLPHNNCLLFSFHMEGQRHHGTGNPQLFGFWFTLVPDRTHRPTKSGSPCKGKGRDGMQGDVLDVKHLSTCAVPWSR